MKKKKKGVDMKTLLIILGACMVGLGIGLMDPGKPKPKMKKKSRKRSEWDDDPFFGTPLQKVD